MKKNDKQTAVYLRVSTGKQDTRSQVPDLVKWCESNLDVKLDVDDLAAWSNRVRGPVNQPNGDGLIWYRDKFTGRTMDRPGLSKIMDALNAGQLERIVVWRLDRLGRTARGLCELFHVLRDRKVDLVSLRDGFSLNTPAGRLHAQILSSVAEYESEVRAERILAGQAAARAKGKTWGGSVAGRRLKVTDAQVEAIVSMKKDGVRITRIASVTGLCRPTIYRVLKNEGR